MSEIAKWDGAVWAPLGTGIDILVYALAVYADASGPALYAGGAFATAGGIASSRIAKWTCLTAPAPDLAITKTNGVNLLTAGGTTTYTILVTNPSPVGVPSATLTDDFPSELTCSWTSTSTGGAAGNTAGSGPAIEDNLSMPIDSSARYVVNCQIAPSATGQITNTATVSVPGDPDLGNNVAIDTDLIGQESDLQVTLTNGVDEVVSGGTVTYSLVVTNNDPSGAVPATLTDTFPPELASCHWQSAADGGASGHTSGIGATLRNALVMPAASSVRYVITCVVSAAAGSTLTNTATITTPADPNSTNDRATDTDSVIARATVKTLILTHFLRMQAQINPSAADFEALLTRVYAVADHPKVDGIVIDVGYAADLTDLYALWDADAASGGANPDLANHVLFGCHTPLPVGCATEKEGIHDLLREKLESHPEASYLMLVGDDRILPMARVRDFTFSTTERDYTPLGNLTPGLTATNTTVGQAAARNRYLSDDPLAVRGPVDIDKLDQHLASFLPELSVGRLVETPAEIVHSIDIFLAQNGVLDLGDLDPDHRVLVTGYSIPPKNLRRPREFSRHVDIFIHKRCYRLWESPRHES